MKKRRFYSLAEHKKNKTIAIKFGKILERLSQPMVEYSELIRRHYSLIE